jgi:hypothetical protein
LMNQAVWDKSRVENPHRAVIARPWTVPCGKVPFECAVLIGDIARAPEKKGGHASCERTCKSSVHSNNN